MSELALFGGPVSVNSLPTRRWPFYSTTVEPSIIHKIRTGDVGATNPDEHIELLEHEFAKRLCDNAYTIFCGSGTAGLLSAYFAMGFSRQAEVLVPSSTFRATVTPLLLLNLVPVFCDSDPETGLIDLDNAASKVTERTEGLVVTHLWGHPVDMDNAVALAKRYGLALIEDCSHAHGSKFNHRPVGTFGDVAVFSLGTKKMVSGGLGGMIVTNKCDVYERALLFSQPKPVALARVEDMYLKSLAGSGLGVNFRASPISAILALDHLDRLPYTISVKNANLLKLRAALLEFLPQLTTPRQSESFTDGTWYSYNCRWVDRDISVKTIVAALKAEGIAVERHFDCLQKEPIFSDQSILTSYQQLPSKPFRCLNTEALHHEVIELDTRYMYEPCDALISQYVVALEKISGNLHSLADYHKGLVR